MDREEQLTEALRSMVGQFAYSDNAVTANFDTATGRMFTADEMAAKRAETTIYTGGLSALEEAFDVLGLSDPAKLTDLDRR